MMRTKWASSILDKAVVDKELQLMNKQQWYSLSSPSLLRQNSPDLSDAFEQLRYCSDTHKFLQESQDITDSICLQVYYNIATVVLRYFMTKTSINGFLGRGRMFLFSAEHLATFLRIPINWDSANKSVVDLGAGDGSITEVLSRFYADVYTTEASQPMVKALQARGFRVLGIDAWQDERYDLISCLNLLDRHSNPIELLKTLHSTATKSDCPVLLAVVLPWSQYVEFGTHLEDRIVLKGRTFDEQVPEFCADVLTPNGFRVKRWTKLPYLCEGDTYQAYYWLENAIFLLEAV